MNEKIAQHRHCRQCGKAFVGNDPFCSVECKGTNSTNLKKKKRQLLMLYVISALILIFALAYVSL
jgi:predicted nucleic acid-binding Zn ribbon protein